MAGGGRVYEAWSLIAITRIAVTHVVVAPIAITCVAVIPSIIVVPIIVTPIHAFPLRERDFCRSYYLWAPNYASPAPALYAIGWELTLIDRYFQLLRYFIAVRLYLGLVK